MFIIYIAISVIINAGNEELDIQKDIKMKENVAYEVPPSRIKMAKNVSYETPPSRIKIARNVSYEIPPSTILDKRK